MRIGVDVGGTNTDAVLMNGEKVITYFKAPTTADIGGGIVNENSHGQCEVTFRNEFLIAKLDGRVVPTVPDLICCLDRETSESITMENLKYGNRVKVIGIAAAPVMRIPEALNIFGPRAFEVEKNFTPLEELC